MTALGIIAAIWGIGSIIVAIWLSFQRAGPTAIDQELEAVFGCALVIFWPLLLVYLIVASPWMLRSWWKSRGAGQ